MNMRWDAAQLRALGGELTNTGETLKGKASAAVRKSAADLQAHAQNHSPIDTGNLRNSISTTMTGELSAEIGPTASYGVFQEFGTRYQAGTPFMRPAADAVEPGFRAAMEQLGAQALGGL